MPSNKPLSHKQIPPGCEPSPAAIAKYLAVWDSLPKYVDEDVAIRKLFDPQSPFRSNSLENALVKTATLNDFYSTSIHVTYQMAVQISRVKDIDARLKRGDLTVVDDIRHLTITTAEEVTKTFDFYSFATKYCSHHYPDKYPIFDSFVFKMLQLIKRTCPNIGLNFKKLADLKDYAIFKKQIDILRTHVNAKNPPSYRDMDRYLWLLGKQIYKK